MAQQLDRLLKTAQKMGNAFIYFSPGKKCTIGFWAAELIYLMSKLEWFFKWPRR